MTITWVYEDDEPIASLPVELYSAAYKASRIVEGVRMFPTIRMDGVQCLIVVPRDVSDNFIEEPHDHD